MQNMFSHHAKRVLASGPSQPHEKISDVHEAGRERQWWDGEGGGFTPIDYNNCKEKATTVEAKPDRLEAIWSWEPLYAESVPPAMPQ